MKDIHIWIIAIFLVIAFSLVFVHTAIYIHNDVSANSFAVGSSTSKKRLTPFDIEMNCITNSAGSDSRVSVKSSDEKVMWFTTGMAVNVEDAAKVEKPVLCK